MRSPKTPSKSERAVEQINDIVGSLSARWDLDLPLIHAHFTPSKLADGRGPESKVSSRIKNLYYNDEALLRKILDDFEINARGSSDASRHDDSGVVAQKQATSEERPAKTSSADLVTSLLQLLGDALSSPKRIATASGQHRVLVGTEQTDKRLADVENGGTGSVSRRLFTSSVQAPSSSALYRDMKLEDFEFPEGAMSNLRQQSDSSEEEPGPAFTTPPPETALHYEEEESPSQRMAALEIDGLGDLGSDETFRKTIDRVPFTSSPSSKRPRPLDSSSPAESRKASRTTSEWINVHAYTAATTPKPSPTTKHNTDKITAQAQKRPLARPAPWSPKSNQVHNQSFTSTTSIDTDNDSSPIWDEAPKSPTTANTSFRSEVPLANEQARQQSLKEVDTALRNVRPAILCSDLIDQSPFSEQNSRGLEAVDIRTRYEVTRVALDLGREPQHLLRNLQYPFEDNGTLWSALRAEARVCGKILPQRSSPTAWARAGATFEKINMTAELALNDSSKGPLFRLLMKPLQFTKSNRLQRRFGNDRFLTVILPNLEKSLMPARFKKDVDTTQDAVVNWLCSTEHKLLGRTWRAFGQKLNKQKKKAAMNLVTPKQGQGAANHVHLFAVSGCDIKPRRCGLPVKYEKADEHTEMSVQELWNWFMPRCCNGTMTYTKAFRRLELVLSTTDPTVTFHPYEILRCDDITPETRLPSPLDPPKSTKIKRYGRKRVAAPKGPVMNDSLPRTRIQQLSHLYNVTLRNFFYLPSEATRLLEADRDSSQGCARISLEAARAVATSLGLTYVPSAIQGRIAGAKGMWLVDHTGQSLEESQRDFWIEVSDSQWKFDVHLDEHGMSTDEIDKDHLTLDVIIWSKPLSPAMLNIQLISVLTHSGGIEQADSSNIEKDTEATRRRAKMCAGLKELLDEDLTQEVGEIKQAMKDPAALRRMQGNQATLVESTDDTVVTDTRTMGALPADRSLQIIWFLEHGFRPEQNSFLNDLCKKTVSQKKEQLQGIRFKVARSTKCFMLPDPLGILEEGEVQLCFSKPFEDPDPLSACRRLDDVDVLVSRNPAHCPWDIQKVRAVVKKELLGYEDVILFSTRGSTPLASILSGGDYDGDKAWVCWEPRIVENFENASPVPSEDPEYFGITRQTEKLEHLTFSEFIHRSFRFNLKSSLLGKCTTFHKCLTYHQKSIAKPAAIIVGTLLGHLVDEAKQGYYFSDVEWAAFLEKLRKEGHLGSAYLPNPAYADYDHLRATDHILDQLVLVTAEKVISREFTALHQETRVSEHDMTDPHLSNFWNQRWAKEDANGKQDTPVKEALRTIIRGNTKIFEDGIAEVDAEGTNKFAGRVDELFAKFNNIKPPESNDPIITNWTRYLAERGSSSEWALLRASHAYRSHSKSKFVWWIAAESLGLLKLQHLPHHNVVWYIYGGLKMDSKYVRRRQRQAITGVDENDFEDVEEEAEE